jgi:hypothetical protein
MKAADDDDDDDDDEENAIALCDIRMPPSGMVVRCGTTSGSLRSAAKTLSYCDGGGTICPRSCPRSRPRDSRRRGDNDNDRSDDGDREESCFLSGSGGGCDARSNVKLILLSTLFALFVIALSLSPGNFPPPPPPTFDFDTVSVSCCICCVNCLMLCVCMLS